LASVKILTVSELNNPIIQESFAIIDQEVGAHNLNPSEYAIARRVIHATGDFEYLRLLNFSQDAIANALSFLPRQVPIITDVAMVKQGITTLVKKTFNNPIIAAIEQVTTPLPGKTLTETGILKCFQQYPQGIYLIGNAPTALLGLCQEIMTSVEKPCLVIGVPVGFVKVVEAKQALAKTPVAKIWVEGRKGGSGVAAAILNALLILAKEND
jgi:precorrin-8X/cobalt-precorrin-8 methylmutase